MSQLFINFKSKSADESLVQEPQKMHLGYPIAVVPIKYWAINETEMNVVTQKIIELVNYGIQSYEEISELLGVPDNLRKVIRYEWARLEQKGILFIENGKVQVRDDEEAFISEEYKDGCLIYDKIRGVFFPYIHDGDYFLTSERKLKTSIDCLEPNILVNKSLFHSEKFISSARNATRVFGEQKKQEIYSGEANLDIQEETSTEEEPKSYRIELKPYDFIQQGNMIVSFEGHVHYNESGPEWSYVKAISPFNGYESRTLYSIIDAQEEGHSEIELFQEVLMDEDIRSLENELLRDEGIDLDIYDKLYQNIAEELGSLTISNSVMELLEAVEKEYIKLASGMKEFVGNRFSQFNSWNLVIEALLDEFTEKSKYHTIQSLTKWGSIHSKHESIIYLKNRLVDVWHLMPEAIQSNTAQKLKFIRGNTVITQTRLNGSRDRVAAILLCELVMKENRAGATVFLDKLNQDPNILVLIDAVSKVRNISGGHYDSKLIQKSRTEFIKHLEEVRTNVYSVIRSLLGEELATNA